MLEQICDLYESKKREYNNRWINGWANSGHTLICKSLSFSFFLFIILGMTLLSLLKVLDLWRCCLKKQSHTYIIHCLHYYTTCTCNTYNILICIDTKRICNPLYRCSINYISYLVLTNSSKNVRIWLILIATSDECTSRSSLRAILR